jgi:hypothetical protein
MMADGATVGNGQIVKPPPMPVADAGIPESLKSLRRWVCWRWTARGNKWDKPPLQCDGHLASSTDPNTWTDYTSALEAHRAGHFDGIGIVLGDLGDARNLAGVDLDDCRDPLSGDYSEFASYILARLDTYAELSPSGTGLKLLLYGRLPRSKTDHERGVELYAIHGRYFTVTGQRLPGCPSEIRDRQDALTQLHAELFPTDDRSCPPSNNGNHSNGQLSDRELALSALAGLNPVRAVGYGDWLGVGMALHSVSPDAEMCSAWDNWSRAGGEKYHPGECARKWQSFGRGGRGGVGLGSLIHWAKLDGWRPSCRDVQEQTAPTDAGSSGKKPTARHVIEQYFREKYDPRHKFESAIYSETLKREIIAAEACFAADDELLELLKKACDIPRREDGRPDVSKFPAVFSKWAKTAWVNMLGRLSEEEDTEEISPSAEERFKARIASAMREQITLSIPSKGTGERDRQERRSLLDWCTHLAKPGKWAGIRSYPIWTCRDAQGVRIAICADLFQKTDRRDRDLKMTQNKLTRLAERYGVGQRAKACHTRAIELDQAFLADVRITPETASTAGDNLGDNLRSPCAFHGDCELSPELSPSKNDARDRA